MGRYKHDVNKVIEGCAEVLKDKMGFNPLQVLRYFHLLDEINGWYYLRDSATHAAVNYNHETKEIRLVEPEEYWVKEIKELYRKWVGT